MSGSRALLLSFAPSTLKSASRNLFWDMSRLISLFDPIVLSTFSLIITRSSSSSSSSTCPFGLEFSRGRVGSHGVCLCTRLHATEQLQKRVQSASVSRTLYPRVPTRKLTMEGNKSGTCNLTRLSYRLHRSFCPPLRKAQAYQLTTPSSVFGCGQVPQGGSTTASPKPNPMCTPLRSRWVSSARTQGASDSLELGGLAALQHEQNLSRDCAQGMFIESKLVRKKRMPPKRSLLSGQTRTKREANVTFVQVAGANVINLGQTRKRKHDKKSWAKG
uniref:Uncharacterized protein n=1 Tax=Rhodosorus marinus TaxID=101924 RepID=A0A7S3A1W0_9RHOD|mmetsp:Transcript_40242/g.159886  ORF Transcript_40242/g.159886 Transcript_40242/m.159886 type:complete len:274 (+) Transcript_40242:671-1492(+)